MIKKFDSFVSEGNDWLSKKDIERGEYGIHHKKTNTNSKSNDWVSKKDIERGEYGIHHKKSNISTYDVNDENISLDDVLEPGDAALLFVADEELLDNFIHYLSKSMSPAAKDRFTKVIKFVK